MTDEEYMNIMAEVLETVILDLISSCVVIIQMRTNKSEKEIVEYMKHRAVATMGLN